MLLFFCGFASPRFPERLAWWNDHYFLPPATSYHLRCALPGLPNFLARGSAGIFFVFPNANFLVHLVTLLQVVFQVRGRPALPL